ncbi:LysR family transcriptional regulator [Paenibacillus spongiae]|uniref:LysR family transcriptional regulator n=1 Tax=Paenibacillus spongiae TaxID=2909671 RepID=A0ABY5S432_9BACL|nr:LysR family transcriptional regulator [Paenibacillus spongiae]UVI28652.1 LysR family transcriptional regulator [Paenibacillus spongiae]
MARPVQNLELYRVFYYTAMTGSLTKAADELFITQPAVTHSIKQLEGRLGGRLFFRTPKGVKLTLEGEALFHYIDQAYQLILNGERKMAEMHDLLDGEIRIGAGDTLCKHVLLPCLGDFHKAYPAISLHVTNRTTPETMALLKEGKIDVGIINLPFAADKQVNVVETIDLHDCFVAGETYREPVLGAISWEELAERPLMMLERGSNTRAYVDAIAEKHGVRLKPEVELGSLDLLADFAKAGLGIACVVRGFVAHDISAGLLQEVKLSQPIPPRKAGIVTLKDSPLPAAANRFIHMLIEGFAVR